MVGQRQMKRNKIYKELVEIFLSLLFPYRCPVCDKILEPENAPKQLIHERCKHKLISVGNHVCMHCGRPVTMECEYCYDCKRKDIDQSFLQGKSLFVYEGAVCKMMYRFKYSNRREYANWFAEEAVLQYGGWIQQKEIDVIIPVPMYPANQKRRGYNQAECFAKALSERIKIPINGKFVKRVRETVPQKELNDIQRKNNLKIAFHCEKNIVQYTKVLLVDDIYTTGSTADAITEMLLKAGVKEVFFLSICIGKGM